MLTKLLSVACLFVVCLALAADAELASSKPRLLTKLSAKIDPSSGALNIRNAPSIDSDLEEFLDMNDSSEAKSGNKEAGILSWLYYQTKCLWVWNWFSCARDFFVAQWQNLGFQADSGLTAAFESEQTVTSMARDLVFTGTTLNALTSLNPFRLQCAMDCASGIAHDDYTPTCAVPASAAKQHTFVASEDEAMLSAHLARAVYSAVSDASSADLGFDMTQDTTHDVQVGLYEHGDTLYISFRGSVSITDWIVDFNICPVPTDSSLFSLQSSWNCGGMMSHSGFQGAYLSVRNVFRQHVQMHAAGRAKVIVTGHSLGGALAVFGAMDLARNGIPGADASVPVALVTFGQPETGNGQWAAAVDALIPGYRRYAATMIDARTPGAKNPDIVTHCCDFVTQGKLGGYGGYKQPSKSWYIETTGGLRNQQGGSEHREGCETMNGIIAMKSCGNDASCAAFGILCHMMQNYCAHWDALGSNCGLDAKYWNPNAGTAAFN